MIRGRVVVVTTGAVSVAVVMENNGMDQAAYR